MPPSFCASVGSGSSLSTKIGLWWQRRGVFRPGYTGFVLLGLVNMSEHHLHRHGSPESGHQSDEESGGHYSSNHESVREQDRLLPIANVSRIMKKALPASAKISKEAKETVQECVSEFISFITGEAADKCQREKRKTVNGDDLLWAMGTLGFEDYLEPLKVYLQKYRELEGEKTTMARQGEQGMGKDVGGCFNGALNGSGTMQIMQQQGPYIYPQHQFVQPSPYHQQTSGDNAGPIRRA